MLQLFDMRETSGLELASTNTLVLQANRLTKCASHPEHNCFQEINFVWFRTFKQQKKLYFESLVLAALGYSRKKTNRDVEDIFFWNPPLEFLGFLLYYWKFQTKQSFTPRGSTKLCSIHPSEILKPKTKTTGNSTLLFLDHPLKLFHIAFN